LSFETVEESGNVSRVTAAARFSYHDTTRNIRRFPSEARCIVFRGHTPALTTFLSASIEETAADSHITTMRYNLHGHFTVSNV